MPKARHRTMALPQALVLGSLLLLSCFACVMTTTVQGAGAEPPGSEGMADNDEDLDDDSPLLVGPMSRVAQRAEALFADGRWSESAHLLKRVADGATGDQDDTRQLAQYHFAIALYRLRFFHASYAIFSQIADVRTHRKFDDTLLWLLALADQLPEPIGVMERIAKYPQEAFARFGTPEFQKLSSQLNYWLGRYKYETRAYEAASKLLERVDRTSPYYLKAQMLCGISYVQARKTRPAIEAFRRIVDATKAGSSLAGDAAEMRDLALISIARTYYSSSVHLGQIGGPSIDERRLAMAATYFGSVQAWSDSWQQSLFEQAWVYFMLGDYGLALGNLHAVEAPYFKNSYYPESDILKAMTSFVLCRYQESGHIATRMLKKYTPIRNQLGAVFAALEKDGNEDRFYTFWEEVHANKSNLPSFVLPIVRDALSGRDLMRHNQHIRSIDQELTRLNNAPESFKATPLGLDISDMLSLSRDLETHNVGILVRQRYQRILEELDEQMDNARKILIDIRHAEGGDLRKDLQQHVRDEPVHHEIILASDEHEIWPFDGEYWPDEMGRYRAVVTSKCH